jgi:RNA polymerase sigma-70 factor (ECF subfamily)
VTSDNELVQRALREDRAAFNELVVRHRKHIYETAYHMVRNHETAEEIAQETFLRAFRSLHTFQRKASFSTWLYRITMNLCINELNRTRVFTNSDMPERAEAFISPVQEMVERERQKWLEREIQALPPTQKSVLILRIYQDMPFKEIARILECTTNAAKVNYRHALLKLKEKVGKLTEDL